MDHLVIQSVHLYNYNLPFVRPFYIKGEKIEERKGVIVHIISDQGAMGFGESAPLEGFSDEPLKKTVHQLSRFKDDLKGLSIPLKRDELLRWLGRYLDLAIVCPSVSFGIESAILTMVANALGQPLCEYLFSVPPKAIPIVGLLQGSQSDIRDQAMTLKAKGYGTFKLKIGSRNIPLDVQKVDALKEVIGRDANIRLDANGLWTFEEALMFCRSIGKNQIEFVEEPCQDVTRWEELYRKTDISIAVDESIRHYPLDRFSEMQGLSAFVVKPTVWGGVTGFLKVLEAAKSSGKKVIVSSTFESGVGMMALANLAVVTGEPAGLGTASWLGADLVQNSVVDDRGLVLPSEFSLRSEMFHDAFKNHLQAV